MNYRTCLVISVGGRLGVGVEMKLVVFRVLISVKYFGDDIAASKLIKNYNCNEIQDEFGKSGKICRP